MFPPGHENARAHTPIRAALCVWRSCALCPAVECWCVCTGVCVCMRTVDGEAEGVEGVPRVWAEGAGTRPAGGENEGAEAGITGPSQYSRKSPQIVQIQIRCRASIRPHQAQTGDSAEHQVHGERRTSNKGEKRLICTRSHSTGRTADPPLWLGALNVLRKTRGFSLAFHLQPECRPSNRTKAGSDKGWGSPRSQALQTCLRTRFKEEDTEP